MRSQIRRYALALLFVLAASAIRIALVPLLGYRYGYSFFLIATFASGRYIGLGPSIFAMLAGAIPAVALHFWPAGQAFDTSFRVATIVYFVLGSVVILMCHSEQTVRWALRREIADRKAVEVELRDSRQQLGMMIEAGRIGTWQLDLKTNAVKWNASMEAMHGYAPGTFGGTLADAIAHDHPEDQQLILQDVGKRLDHANRTYRVLRDDGSIRWIEGTGQTIRDESGEPVQMLGVCFDVTERKESEMALLKAMESLEAEQELLRHTIEFQDQQRQLIAYEIHDGLVQYATGALMQLEALAGRAESEAIAQQISAIAEVLHKAVAEGRRIINGIRTPVLDDWGVVAAIEQLIDDEERAHVHVEFVKDPNLGRMDRGVEEALYRITQEAITNIHKHSQAKEVRIELGRQGDRVHLAVRDWGVGFTPTNGAKHVHGLMGMSERARIAGGQCTIQSAPGKGTEVIVDLPYTTRA